VRHARRQGGGGQLGLREMALLYGPRKPREPETFEDRVRRLRRLGMQPGNIAFVTGGELEDVLAALSQDVQA
jgi:hypothetical protein